MELKIDLNELEEFKRKNSEDRMKFVEFWAEYVRTHSDKDWSKRQNIIIDSQMTKVKTMVKKNK